MKKTIFRVLGVSFILLNSVILINAKRLAPVEVEPVIYNGTELVVNQENIGTIEQFDMETEEKIGEIEVYKIKYDRSLERDVQDIFINQLELSGDNLVVYREDGEKYEFNLKEMTDLNNKKTLNKLIFIGIIILIAVGVWVWRKKSV